MKRYFIGSLAVVFAFAAFAFTNATQKNLNFKRAFDCTNPQLVWFFIPTTQPCQTDLNNAIAIIGNAAADAESKTQAQYLTTVRTSCNAADDCICAIAFKPSQSEVVRGADGKYHLVSGLTAANVDCVVYRP